MAGNDANTVSLVHFDNSLTDFNAGGAAKTWTNNGATFAAGKFDQAIVTGPSKWVTTPAHADFSVGAADFTVEFWLRLDSAVPVARYICGDGDASLSGSTPTLYFQISAGNKLLPNVKVGLSNVTIFTAAIVWSADGIFHHYEFSRNGGSIRQFIDGTQDGSTTAISGTVNSSTNPWSIGRAGLQDGSYFPGAIDEFRFSKGIARHTANFTPPTAPYNGEVKKGLQFNMPMGGL